MNYDSRSTWDSGLDAGSIPARSIYCGKEGPIEDGRIPYHAGRRPRTKFVYYSVCYFCIRRKEAIGFFDGIEQAKKWLLDERRDLVLKVFLRFSLIEVVIMIRKLQKDCVKFFV